MLTRLPATQGGQAVSPNQQATSAHRFEAIIETAPDAMVIADEKGKIVLVNRQTEVIFGYPRSELLGSQVEMLMPAGFRTKHQAHRSGYHEKPKVRAMGSGLELFAMRKDGSQFRVEISLSPLGTPGGNLVFASIRDITERIKAEEKFKSLLEAAPDAMIIANEKGEIVLVNQQTEAVFGYDRTELIGRPVEQLMPTAFRERHKMHRTNFFTYPKVRSMGIGLELYALRKNGSQFPVEISLSPLDTGQGMLVSASVRDITDRKNLEEQLRMFNKDLEEQVRAKTKDLQEAYENVRQLAIRLEDIREEERSSIAREIHDEIGQQLTGIKMDISWLSQTINPAEGDALAERFRDARQLVDNSIRTVRKISTELRPAILDDLGIIAAIQWQSEEFEKRYAIKTKFRSMPFDIFLPSRIAIALFRICQESLTNVARHSFAKNVTILFLEEENAITLTIKDDGIGFDIEEKKFKGTLGLFGMRERALLIGGELQIISERGAGTTLTVTFKNPTEP